MDEARLRQLAQQMVAGQIPADQFMALVQSSMSVELPDTTLDLERPMRCGYPEVIYGDGKTAESIRAIIHQLIAAKQPVLVTRIDHEKASQLESSFPSAKYNCVGRTLRIDASGDHATQTTSAVVSVVTAGTSDLPVAEEARETLEWMKVPVHMVHDVGVAGPHRLPMHAPRLRKSAAIVVVAGMEGALPSVVGGYVRCPIIAVPTSIGYGAAFSGLAALLGMLNSCAANVAVVNIDAGFKAGYLAGMIAHRSRADVTATED